MSKPIYSLAENYILSLNPTLYLPLWKRDGTVLMSSDSYGRSCTVTGAIWSPHGRIFDGSDDKITVPTQTVFNLIGDFTLISWVNYDSVKDWWEGPILYKADGVGGDNKRWFFGYDLDNTATLFYTHNGTIDAYMRSNAWTLSTGKFYCLGITRKGSTFTTFLNGNSNGTVTSAIVLESITADMIIGKGEGTDPYDGIIGELLMVSHALSPIEILHIYQLTKWRYV